MALMPNNCDEVIDLTNSFTLVNHYAVSDAVIEVLDTDESLLDSPIAPPIAVAPSKNKKSKIPKRSLKAQAADNVIVNKNVNEPRNIGECPICYDSLGKKPLAATKCGHVFCMQCLKLCLKVDRKCPTCRSILRGSSSYHPLYF